MGQGVGYPRADLAEIEGQLARLREPFGSHEISKLPKGTDKNAPKASCGVCGGYHEPAKFHLDYVGHAQVTNRLLDIDPLWSWEPLGVDEFGRPALERDKSGSPVGLWIRLTVCGANRIGYGSCEGGKQEAVKELIGDAIRNAAMRFGVALDLWKKEDRPQFDQGASVRRAPKPVTPKASTPEPVRHLGDVAANAQQKKRLAILADQLSWDDDRRHAEAGVATFNDLTMEKADELLGQWQKMLIQFKRDQRQKGAA